MTDEREVPSTPAVGLSIVFYFKTGTQKGIPVGTTVGENVLNLNFSINFSIGFDARKAFEMTANKFREIEQANRAAVELQLLREKDANELFSRLYPEIERLARNRVEAYAYDTRVGNILSVATTPPTEIQVSRKEQVEALVFSFDSLREVQVVYEGKVRCRRILRVETATGSGTKPILTYQSRPDEPFVRISWNNLPQIVAECVDTLLI